MTRYLVYTDESAAAADLEARLAPKLGWTNPTGDAVRNTFATSTATLEETAQRLKALIDDLITREVLSTDPDPEALTTIEISPTPITITLSVPPSTVGLPDPSLLLLAESGAGSILPDLAAVGALQLATAAGSTYADPETGRAVLRLTGPTVPFEDETGHEHGYTKNRISQSFEVLGVRYATVILTSDWMADIRLDTLAVSNWRQLPQSPIGAFGETGTAWSRNPLTPRILYFTAEGGDGSPGRVLRFNTETMAEEPLGPFPWRPVRPVGATGRLEWIQVTNNDQYMSAQWGGALSTTVHYLRVADGREAYYQSLQFDEHHLDCELDWAYIKIGNDAVVGLRLADGLVRTPTDIDSILGSSHGTAICGGFIGLAYSAPLDTDVGAFVWRPDLDEMDHFITTRAGFHSAQNEWYNAGGWSNARRSLLRHDQWFLADKSRNDAAELAVEAKIRKGWLSFVRTLDGEVRHLAVHGSSAFDYDASVQQTIGLDGRLVMWTSDMNVPGGRYDVFITSVPTGP